MQNVGFLMTRLIFFLQVVPVIALIPLLYVMSKFFAGGSSYHTGTVNPNLEKTNQYFPKDIFLTFDNANPTQIIGNWLML